MKKPDLYLISVDLIEALQLRGINAKLKVEAKTGSCYITLGDPRLGQCRVGDHDERTRYGYRWQVRLDAKFPYVDETKGHRRFFYPPNKLERMAEHIANYRKAIERREQQDLKTPTNMLTKI